jgi:hypothetical protein
MACPEQEQLIWLDGLEASPVANMEKYAHK